jgi:hypothetical protein
MVFWVLTQCGLVDGYQRFGGIYRRHLQGKDGGDTSKPEDCDRDCSFGVMLRNIFAVCNGIKKII